MTPTIPEQRYGPTSGALTGWLGVVTCVVLEVVLAVHGWNLVEVRWMVGILLAGVLIATMMLRPVIVLAADQLELRNPFSSWLIPVALVEVVQVRVVTRITAAGTPYDAVAVGRRVRPMVRGDGVGLFSRRALPQFASAPARRDASTPEALADLMTEQILVAAEDARARRVEPGPVRRAWAVVPLAATGLLLAALVVTLLL